MSGSKTITSHLRALVGNAVLSVLLVLTGAATAHAAQCTISNSPTTISFGTVTVPRDTAVGAAIGPVMTSTVSVSCPASKFYLQDYPGLPVSSTVANVWETGMAGIGVRVQNSGYNNYALSSVATPGWAAFTPTTSGSAFTTTYTFTYQLVKTAAQVPTGGPLVVNTMFSLSSHDVARNTTAAASAATNIGNTTIVASTCSVTTPNIAVALPSVAVNDLSTVGATAGDTRFQIGLSCNSGANVYITLTDATKPANQTNQLTLASGSTASGVALRLLKQDSTPVSYGPDSALPGTVNQWLVGTSASTANIPLVAQYVSTGTVKPGKVKGEATFTLSYQ